MIEVTAPQAANVEEPSPKDVLNPSVKTAIDEAQQLISVGKIGEARRRLIDLNDKSPETALALARSFSSPALCLRAQRDH